MCHRTRVPSGTPALVRSRDTARRGTGSRRVTAPARDPRVRPVNFPPPLPRPRVSSSGRRPSAAERGAAKRGGDRGGNAAGGPRSECSDCGPRPASQGREVPGTGLEPVRPRGAARFKLAVSAFHHPGRPWAPHRGSEPIGAHHPNSGRADRCCLILLMSEGASVRCTGRQHLPTASRTHRARVRELTEFHRPNAITPNPGPDPGPAPGSTAARHALPGADPDRSQGTPSSPGMTPPLAVRPEAAPGTGTAGDYIPRIGTDDGTRPQQRPRPDRSTLP